LTKLKAFEAQKASMMSIDVVGMVFSARDAANRMLILVRDATFVATNIACSKNVPERNPKKWQKVSQDECHYHF
jgi:hypothetical protein